MSSTLTGTATIYGLDGVTVAFSGLATTDNEAQSLSLRDEFDVADARGKDGQIFAKAATGRRHRLEVTIMFKDPGGAATRASAAAKLALPAPLSKATLAGFGDGLIDGDWNCEGASFELSNSEFHRATLSLTRSGESPAAFNTVAAA